MNERFDPKKHRPNQGSDGEARLREVLGKERQTGGYLRYKLEQFLLELIPEESPLKDTFYGLPLEIQNTLLLDINDKKEAGMDRRALLDRARSLIEQSLELIKMAPSTSGRDDTLLPEKEELKKEREKVTGYAENAIDLGQRAILKGDSRETLQDTKDKISAGARPILGADGKPIIH